MHWGVFIRPPNTLKYGERCVQITLGTRLGLLDQSFAVISLRTIDQTCAKSSHPHRILISHQPSSPRSTNNGPGYIDCKENFAERRHLKSLDAMFNLSEERKFFHRTCKDVNVLLSVARKPLCPIDLAVVINPSYALTTKDAETLLDSWSVLLNVLHITASPPPKEIFPDATISPLALALFRVKISQRSIRAFTDSALGITPGKMPPDQTMWQAIRVR